MQIVVGLSLKNLKPNVWDPESEYYLDQLEAVMVSYAEFDEYASRRREAMQRGLHECLGIPKDISIYLDNGAFSFMKKEREVPRAEYEKFVDKANPNWYPIPQDYIPAPSMNKEEQRGRLKKTMDVNTSYSYDGFVPVMHVSQVLDEYMQRFQEDEDLSEKDEIAIGGIVPNLLRAHKALKYKTVLSGLRKIRKEFSDVDLHLFGVGGTSTLHVAALLRMNSVDSTGWRNRAARGIIQLPGSGDRSVADLGSWRGRELSDEEWDTLGACECPACQKYGLEGLKAKKLFGFCNRATHNLWVLLEEAHQINAHLEANTYADWYTSHVENSIYKPLIDFLLEQEES